MRRGLAWLVAAPLMLGGSELAHALAYRLVYPQAHARLIALLATGHSYVAWLPVVFALAGACVLASLAVTVVDAVRGRPVRALPAYAFAGLPPLAFALQELLELSLHTGTFAWHAVLAPTFWRGLVLQLPFGLAAYLVVAILLRTASVVAEIVATRRDAPVVARSASRSLHPALVILPRRAPLAGLAADRAPPLPAH